MRKYGAHAVMSITFSLLLACIGEDVVPVPPVPPKVLTCTDSKDSTKSFSYLEAEIAAYDEQKNDQVAEGTAVKLGEEFILGLEEIADGDHPDETRVKIHAQQVSSGKCYTKEFGLSARHFQPYLRKDDLQKKALSGTGLSVLEGHGFVFWDRFELVVDGVHLFALYGLNILTPNKSTKAIQFSYTTDFDGLRKLSKVAHERYFFEGNGERVSCEENIFCELREGEFMRLGDYGVGWRILQFGRVYQPSYDVFLHGRYGGHYESPKTLYDVLFSSVVALETYNYKTWELDTLHLALYRALTGPDITYENTVWGKLRVQDDKEKYVWHRADYDKAQKYCRNYDRPLSAWNPDESVDWRPGEQVAHDDLATTVATDVPLIGGWEAYDLEYVPERESTLRDTEQRSNDANLPIHVRRSLLPGGAGQGRGQGALRFKVRKR